VVRTPVADEGGDSAPREARAKRDTHTPTTSSSRHTCAAQANGAQVNVGVQPSNCVITKLKLDKDRKAILERKDRSKAPAAAATDVIVESNMAGVD